MTAQGTLRLRQWCLFRAIYRIAINRHRYYLSLMSVLTCKLPSALDGRLSDLAKRRGVPKSVLVREAIEAKIAEEAAAPRRPASNLIEALGDSIGSIASGKRDLASNKKHLKGYGR
jgi:predicted DNA-binding protein